MDYFLRNCNFKLSTQSSLLSSYLLFSILFYVHLYFFYVLCNKCQDVCFIRKKEISKNKIKRSYNPPATSYNFYLISLAWEKIQLRQQQEGQIVGLGWDAFIWVWLLLCKIHEDIFVCAYISLNTKQRCAYLPKVRLRRSLNI